MLKAVFPYNGNTKELLLTNRKALFSLDTKYHFALLRSELALLEKTLELDASERATSKDLLDKYIPAYEKDIQELEGKQKKSVSKEGKKKEQESLNVRKSLKINLKSIEVEGERNPSIKKKSLSIITISDKHEDKRKNNSAKKLLESVWNHITSSRTERLKKKEKESERRQEMKDYVE